MWLLLRGTRWLQCVPLEIRRGCLLLVRSLGVCGVKCGHILDTTEEDSFEASLAEADTSTMRDAAPFWSKARREYTLSCLYASEEILKCSTAATLV